MRKFLLIGSLAMLMMGAAAPLALAHDQDRGGEMAKRCGLSGSPPTAGWSRSTPSAPAGLAASARSPGFQTTSRWSASTTASRTGSCTALATRVGSTP